MEMSLPQSADDANKLSTAARFMDSRNTFSQVEAGNFAINEPAGSGVRLGAVPACKMEPCFSTLQRGQKLPSYDKRDGRTQGA